MLFLFWFGGSECSVLWCYFPDLRWLCSLFCSRRIVLKILCGQSSDSKCPTVSQHEAVMTSLLARWSRVVQELTEQGSNTWAYHSHLEALFKQTSGPTCKVSDLIKSGGGAQGFPFLSSSLVTAAGLGTILWSSRTWIWNQPFTSMNPWRSSLTSVYFSFIFCRSTYGRVCCVIRQGGPAGHWTHCLA